MKFANSASERNFSFANIGESICEKFFDSVDHSKVQLGSRSFCVILLAAFLFLHVSVNASDFLNKKFSKFFLFFVKNIKKSTFLGEAQ